MLDDGRRWILGYNVQLINPSLLQRILQFYDFMVLWMIKQLDPQGAGYAFEFLDTTLLNIPVDCPLEIMSRQVLACCQNSFLKTSQIF